MENAIHEHGTISSERSRSDKTPNIRVASFVTAQRTTIQAWKMTSSMQRICGGGDGQEQEVPNGIAFEGAGP
jgi:hypothetical protein